MKTHILLFLAIVGLVGCSRQSELDAAVGELAVAMDARSEAIAGLSVAVDRRGEALSNATTLECTNTMRIVTETNGEWLITFEE